MSLSSVVRLLKCQHFDWNLIEINSWQPMSLTVSHHWHWQTQRLVTCSMPSHHLNKYMYSLNAQRHICITQPHWVNSLAPGKFEWNFRHVIFKQISVIDGWGISCEIVLIWMSLDFTNDQSTLVQVMAWCHQATSHYLSQCWPRSLSLYGVIRPQWVNSNLQLSTTCTKCACILSEILHDWLALSPHSYKTNLNSSMNRKI